MEEKLQILKQRSAFITANILDQRLSLKNKTDGLEYW